ncbi:MAG: sigma 54-interacting transcriptional regulator [Rhodocyclaceae bacterium]
MTEKNPLILVVDDETHVRTLLEAVLSREGYRICTALNGAEAVRCFGDFQPDLVLMDIRMPRMDGLRALQAIREMRKNASVILMTAFAAVDTAVQALRLGAFDYIIKPFDIDELKLLVERALQMAQMKAHIKELHQALTDAWRLDRILTVDAGMRALCQTVGRVAPSQASVLVTGESGTGKELIARALHYNSPRAKGPFIKINCGALPEGVLESELFGHEKGAFSGAIMRRRGRFEQASGGTLFLDEIGEISPALQVKLLRVLQEREFERVGGETTLHTDIRVLAATNRDIEAMVQAGSFRADLYYRLNVVRLRAPALRDRPDDIPLLAEHFLQRHAAENNREIVGFDQDAMNLMRRHDWPGNIRELDNAVMHAVVMGSCSLVLAEDLPENLRMAQSAPNDVLAEEGPSLRDELKRTEARLIRLALTRYEGNRVHAARALGICRRTLMYKLQEHGIT